MSLLLNALFSAVALGHFTVDVLNGQRAILFAYLSEPLGLTNAQLGLVSTAYVFANSLTQPLFGYLTDRFGPRWVISGGVLWMGVLYTLGLLTPGAAGLALLVLAGMGSGAFHPAGTMQATTIGRAHYASRETTATSVFFFMGQMGLFLGPLLGGQLLDRIGPEGIIFLTVLTLPVALNALFRLRGLSPQIAPANSHDPENGAAPRLRWVLLALILMTAMRSWAQQNMITFVPKYLSDLGQNPATYGVLAALFFAGVALGNVIGGNLADRFGKRLVAGVVMALAAVPLVIIPTVGWSPWLYLLIPLTGSLTGAAHSIIIVLAQRLLPTGMALASGLTLGFMFSSGAVGTLLTGYLADLQGFPIVFQLTAALVLLAALLTRGLPKT